MTEQISRLDYLRAQTRTAHQRIEAVPALARLMCPDLQRGEYTGVLAALLQFHQAIEPAIWQALEIWPVAQALLDGRRVRALADDLAYLGVVPWPTRPVLTPLATASHALGALYVVEGASLGGRVIARHVGDSLGMAPGHGGSFYGGLSAEAARALWADLGAVLENPTLAVDMQALGQGACAAFEDLDRWMRRVPATQACLPLAVGAAA